MGRALEAYPEIYEARGGRRPQLQAFWTYLMTSLSGMLPFSRAAQDWEVDTFTHFYNLVFTSRVNGGG